MQCLLLKLVKFHSYSTTFLVILQFNFCPVKFTISNRDNFKLRQLGLSNQIVDDSDSKPSELERQFWSISKFDNNIVLYQIVSISFQLNSTNFLLNSITFDIFSISFNRF